MTWECKACEAANLWWRNRCEECGEPLPGFDRKRDELLQQMLDAIKIIETQPMPVPVPVYSRPLWGDCNCPTYGTCMNTACPRQMRFTS